ncbi:MAG: polyprenol monophosphomannose synthase [Thaumarchaeota archaeon]|nr:polyprenol monophosphomannose synthase [Nitrososphaerota archaeon]
MTSAPRTVVILPTYNEKENVSVIFERLSKTRQGFPGDLHLLFVDDGSPDGTAEEVEKLVAGNDYVHLLQRGSKQGLGTAYLDGFRFGIDSLGASVFVQMDSDLQHPPESVKPLVEALRSGEGAEVAIGSRYIPGGSFKGLKGSRRVVSWGANWMARHILGLGVHDTTTGFKALSRRAVETLLAVKFHSSGFIFQVESLYIFKRNGLRVVEIPFVFELRERGTSKMSDKEVWEFFRSVLAMRFRNYKVSQATGKT